MVMILSADEMMVKGLLLIGMEKVRIDNSSRRESIRFFKAHFGCTPVVVANIWEDLQTTSIQAAKVKRATHKLLNEFLWSLNFLFAYSTEAINSVKAGYSEKSFRKFTWNSLRRLQALKDAKIVWPSHWSGPNSPIFIITVDGTHCPIFEPTKGYKYSKNPKYYSHKFNKSGLAYEVALSIFTNQIVWVNGLFPAGTQDPTIFKKALLGKVPHGKKVIADSAYKQKDLPCISVAYPSDCRDVRTFKKRARARQESIFAKMKNFSVLNDTFRHGEAKHKVCFEAVAVIVQYQIDQVPLFDV